MQFGAAGLIALEREQEATTDGAAGNECAMSDPL